MQLTDLTAIIPPPKKPLLAPSRDDWLKIESKLELKLPSAYFEVVSTYGRGRFFQSELFIKNPNDPDFRQWLETELDHLEAVREQSPEEIPFASYSNDPGLFPLGFDYNGNSFYWLATAKHNNWPIVCVPDTFLDWEEPLEISLIDFLVQMVTNKLPIIYSNFWGNLFSEEFYDFDPEDMPPIKKTRKRKK